MLSFSWVESACCVFEKVSVRVSLKMGFVLSRFRRSTKERLEELQKEIDRLEENRRYTKNLRKVLDQYLVTCSLLIFIVISYVFLFHYYPVTIKDFLIYWIPSLLFPLLLGFSNKCIQPLILKIIRHYDEALLGLKKRKKSILKTAMENETYQEVKKLLNTYDHEKMFETRIAIEDVPSSLSLQRSFTDMEEVPKILIRP